MSNAEQNKLAWEHKVYEWRIQFQGNPEVVAEDILASPEKFLRYHAEYFSDISDKYIASVCGSDGRRAVALAVMGAKATVFDISEPQSRYALELANAANVKIEYEVGDFCQTNTQKYAAYFDLAYCEGGILHYFHDLNMFFATLWQILKTNGVLILCDYHPFRKTITVDLPQRNIEKTEGDYFDNRIHIGHVPYMKFFSKDKQKLFPDCLLRFYTLSEIFNSVIRAGFSLKEFNKHPKCDNHKFPGEFTLIAQR